MDGLRALFGIRPLLGGWYAVDSLRALFGIRPLLGGCYVVDGVTAVSVRAAWSGSRESGSYGTAEIAFRVPTSDYDGGKNPQNSSGEGE